MEPTATRRSVRHMKKKIEKRPKRTSKQAAKVHYVRKRYV